MDKDKMIEITAYLEALVSEYRGCGCELCARRLAGYIANKVQEAKNYRDLKLSKRR